MSDDLRDAFVEVLSAVCKTCDRSFAMMVHWFGEPTCYAMLEVEHLAPTGHRPIVSAKQPLAVRTEPRFDPQTGWK